VRSKDTQGNVSTKQLLKNDGLPDTSGTGTFLQSVQVSLDGLLEIVKVCFIKTVNGTGSWDAYIGVSVQERALIWIESKAIDAGSQRQH
jgi:hypothetical protein